MGSDYDPNSDREYYGHSEFAHFSRKDLEEQLLAKLDECEETRMQLSTEFGKQVELESELRRSKLQIQDLQKKLEALATNGKSGAAVRCCCCCICDIHDTRFS